MGKNCRIDSLKTEGESVKAIIAVEGYETYPSPVEILIILILEERSIGRIRDNFPSYGRKPFLSQRQLGTWPTVVNG